MEFGEGLRGGEEVVAEDGPPPVDLREQADQRDVLRISSGDPPGGRPVRFNCRSLDSDQIVEEFDPAVEPVVAVGQAAPELAGGFLADIGDAWAVASSESPVTSLSAADVGGPGQVELLLGGEDVLADPEVVTETDLVVDASPGTDGKSPSGACGDAAAAGPAKNVIVRDGGPGRGETFGVKVGDRAGQVLSGLAAEDAESVCGGQVGLQPA
ncbi:hypothetical protein ACIQ6V_28520 [Streptomyces sp. NPDC096198]|uniref:hypothetical protein n=1 Tax=Streptomyces sp. NPDC096198 TaxID=3366080 RepID=UPI00382F4FFA